MSQTQRSAPDDQRSAPDDAYVVFTRDDFVFTGGRRFRWWWQLATRPAAVTSFVVAGVAAIGTVAVQAHPHMIGGAGLEPPVTKLPVAAHRIASAPPATNVASPRVPPRVAAEPTATLIAEKTPQPVAPRKPAPPQREQIARTAATVNETTHTATNPAFTVKTAVAPVTISSRGGPVTTAPRGMKGTDPNEPMPPPTQTVAATQSAVTSRTAGASRTTGTSQAAGTTAAAPGWLVVSSRPWGSLYVDGRAYGTTPQTNLWLPPGAHRVEIRRPGFQPFVASVTIDSNREHRLTRVTLTPASQ